MAESDAGDVPPEPATVCAALLAALAASDGRRKKRKRDTTADAIGMSIKRELLDRAVRERPSGDDFEGWLVAQCLQLAESGVAPTGASRAMASDLLAEWRMAATSPSFREWLEKGAPSADAEEG